MRTTTWSGINPKSFASGRDNILYMGHAGIVSKYSGYQDNTSDYLMFYRSTWLNQGTQQIKIPKKMKAIIGGGYGYTVTFTWAFDYDETAYTTTIPITQAVAPAEYGIAEYGIAEYSGGAALSTIGAQMTRNGEYLQFGWSVGISGQPINFQTIDVYTKIGRLNR